MNFIVMAKKIKKDCISPLDTFGINKLKMQRIDWDPYIGFAVLE